MEKKLSINTGFPDYLKKQEIAKKRQNNNQKRIFSQFPAFFPLFPSCFFR
jgi:hypothetical protein